jgi:3-oxoacyl-[acyl-carrier-protein] synthase-3
MNGKEVMNFALSQVPPLLDSLLEHCATTRAELDLVVFHQANQFMINYLRKMTGLPAERVPIGLADVGNTGPSSIPLLLARRQGLDGRSLAQSVLCGFGIGLSLGAARLDLSNTALIDPVDVPVPARTAGGQEFIPAAE